MGRDTARVSNREAGLRRPSRGAACIYALTWKRDSLTKVARGGEEGKIMVRRLKSGKIRGLKVHKAYTLRKRDRERQRKK